MRFLYFIVVCAMFPFFFWGSPSYYASPVIKELWNLGHVVFFALTGLILLRQLNSRSWFYKAGVVLAYAVTLGVLIEVVQLTIGRGFSWRDIYLDLLGALLAIAILIPPIKRAYRLISISAVLLLVLAEQLALLRAVKMEVMIYRQAPIIASFTSRDSLKQWRGSGTYLDKAFSRNNADLLVANFKKNEKYTGLSLDHLYANWQDYRQVTFSFYNPEKETALLNIKITDDEHDEGHHAYNNRFNHQVELAPGWQKVSLPLTDIENAPRTRLLATDKISRIGFFMTNLVADKVLYIESIKLEK